MVGYDNAQYGKTTTVICEAMYAVEKKKEFIHYFQLTGRCLATSWKERLHQLMVTWVDKCHSHEHSCFLLISLSFLLLNMTSYDMELSLWSV